MVNIENTISTVSTVSFAEGTIVQSSFDSMHLVDDPTRAMTIIHTDASRCHIVCDLGPEQVILRSQDQCSSRLSTYGIWRSSLLSAKVNKIR
jgi:anion-transporting  ArsA/GET3 family ATPase